MINVLDTHIPNPETELSEAAQSRFFYDKDIAAFALEHFINLRSALRSFHDDSLIGGDSEELAHIMDEWRNRFNDLPALPDRQSDPDGETLYGFLFSLYAIPRRKVELDQRGRLAFNAIDNLPTFAAESEEAQHALEAYTKEDWEKYREAFRKQNHGFKLDEDEFNFLCATEALIEQTGRLNDANSIIRKVGEVVSARMFGAFPVESLSTQMRGVVDSKPTSEPVFFIDGQRVYFNKWDEIKEEKARAAKVDDYRTLIEENYRLRSGEWPYAKPRPIIENDLKVPEVTAEDVARKYILPTPERLDIPDKANVDQKFAIRFWNKCRDLLPDGRGVINKRYIDEAGNYLESKTRGSEKYQAAEFVKFDASRRDQGIFVWQVVTAIDGEQILLTLRVTADETRAFGQWVTSDGRIEVCEEYNSKDFMNSIKNLVGTPGFKRKSETMRKLKASETTRYLEQARQYPGYPTKLFEKKTWEQAQGLKELTFTSLGATMLDDSMVAIETMRHPETEITYQQRLFS